MKILVTGGAGFIASHLCDRLVARGHGVVAVDNLSLGRRAHLAQLDGLPGFRFAEMDVADAPQLRALFEAESFDAVFHMAANSDIARSHADPETDFGNTLRTTYSVLEAMRRNGVGQLVFASTSAIYGEVQGRVREDHGPLLPISHYGAAKLASEAFISSYGENYGIRSWMARFPNVVGERSTHGAVYDFVRKLRRTPGRLEVLGDGTQVKPYLHVADLLDGILLAWGRMSDRTNVFNLGGTTRCTVRRMAEIVVEESGSDAVIDFTGGDRGWIGDVPSVDYDTGRIRALGWEPRLDSEAAVRRAARWMLDHTP
ncbi:SDR family NAD(P)-dependent oxidoreductase [Roseomonas sp. BN140053]|uniref:SDR family NAD(P)-dependent oxidoreductase n=1 Tax=Roseomonas sp. BN140053 TaxID=3391898 RepID=UPI0039E731DC